MSNRRLIVKNEYGQTKCFSFTLTPITAAGDCILILFSLIKCIFGVLSHRNVKARRDRTR